MTSALPSPPTLSFLLALSLLVPSASAQQGGAQDGGGLLERARARRAEREGPARPEILGKDGQPLLPGKLPPGTAKEASQLWSRVLETSPATRPIRSFELSFFFRYRDPEHPQSNDLDLDFSYLAPGYVRAELESGRTLLRGPDGDYLVDAGETIELVGREATEDLEQLDSMQDLASFFIGLSNPRNLRVYDLALVEEPTLGPHPSLAKSWEGLRWLRVVSPDVRVGERSSKIPRPPLDAVTLGVEPETSRIRYALIQERRTHLEGSSEVEVLEVPTARLVRLDQLQLRNDYLVPHEVEVFGVDLGASPPRFARRPTTELKLRKRRGSLRAGLRPGDFEPPR